MVICEAVGFGRAARACFDARSVVVQWDKKTARYGIIKVDLLGLGMMAAIKIRWN